MADASYFTEGGALAEMRFPDGSTVPVKVWNDLMVETTRWLTNNGLLNSSHCPISVSPKRNLAATSRIQPTGKPMRSPKQVNSLYVEVHYARKALVTNALTIIKWVDQSPTEFKVRFA